MSRRSHSDASRVAQRVLFSLLASLPVVNVLVLLGGSLWSAHRRRIRLAERERLLTAAEAQGINPCQACKRAGHGCPGCDAAAACHSLNRPRAEILENPMG